MPDEVVQTSFGKFLIDPRDLIGSTTKAGTLWDGPGFLQVIAKEHGRLGEPGVAILDVGANIGTFSVWLASHGAWQVIAVEPVPSTMQRLKANLDLNQATCAGVVVPIEVAAYDRNTTLFVPCADLGNRGGVALQPSTALDHGDAHWVPEPHNSARAVPLDQYRWLWNRRLSLVKIDAQGCDGRAVLGLEQTLRQHHPTVVFEWEADLAALHGVTLADLLAWLTTLGYATWEWPSQPNNYLAVHQGGVVSLA